MAIEFWVPVARSFMSTGNRAPEMEKQQIVAVEALLANSHAGTQTVRSAVAA
jgi:hypothetical protein